MMGGALCRKALLPVVPHVVTGGGSDRWRISCEAEEDPEVAVSRARCPSRTPGALRSAGDMPDAAGGHGPAAPARCQSRNAAASFSRSSRSGVLTRHSAYQLSTASPKTPGSAATTGAPASTSFAL